MAAREIDIDKVVDYRAEYTAVVQKYKLAGDKLTGLCPFHEDRNNSLSVDLKTGKWHCFAEDEGGNFVTFYAELHGVDTKEAYKQILEKYGVAAETPKPAKKEKTTVLEDFSLAEYAFAKHLPEEWLAKTCRLETRKDRNNGTAWLCIPYYNAAGEESTYRKRYAHKDFRWRTGSSGKICLYGEWRIPEFANAGYAVMVEGESDTQSLWYMGIPAIGVPGASMFKPEQSSVLQGLKLYLHHEPDGGGDTFIHKICTGLRDGGYEGEVYEWSCKALGEKDPSDLYIKHGREQAAKLIRDALKTAKPVDYKKEDIPEAISGAPISLRQPEGWIYSDKGISRIDEKKFQPVLCCRTPIILTKRLQSIETGEEKIEVAFKRDGVWQSAIYPRSVIFQSRSITALADLGCTITSENSKQVVRFLGSLEAENIDIIPKEDSTSTFGWQPGNRFVPGHADGITLDIDPSQKAMATAYCQNGTFEKWVEHMDPHRSRQKFRFILAASFAAPLLRIVKQRIFFVYNWGGSKGGKTAALKAALSAWGDPERLMANFNATQVALERMAGFFCDLPLGIDERQLAGSKQEGLEKIVYMLANGTGRSRGSKDGGLQELRTWRSVILATGEEPIGKANSQTGVNTRVLEVIGAPFEDEASASDMHQQAALNCGWAGPEFIQYILDTGDQAILDEYQDVVTRVRDLAGTKNGSHVAAVATVALADRMLSRCIFHETPEQAAAETERMTTRIVADLKEQEQPDVNEQAAQFIADWINSNIRSFVDGNYNQRFGYVDGDLTCIFPSLLREALENAGFSYRKTMTWLAENEICQVDKAGKYQIVKKYDGRPVRMIVLDTVLLATPPSETDEDGFTVRRAKTCRSDYAAPRRAAPTGRAHGGQSGSGKQERPPQRTAQK